jgi:Zn-dependent membrane protease YugP
MFFDPIYLLFIAPGLILAFVAQSKVKSTFHKYSQIASSSRMTGADAARTLLKFARVDGVKVNQTSGFLSDHYNPVTKELNLSDEVYGSSSLSAIGVACHEAGHAIQHARHYAPLALRSFMVPATQFCSNFSFYIIFAGFFLRPLLIVGIVLFAVGVVFSIVTLPVEWDASARAKVLMVEAGIVSRDEAAGAGSVLNAAFLTYLASAITAVMTLLYYLLRA